MKINVLIDDLRYATRVLRKSPGFVLAAAFTVALGIGATTTIFSVANALMIQTPLGVRSPERLVTVFIRDESGSLDGMLSYPTFRSVSESETGLADFGALSLFRGSISTGLDAEPQRIAGLAVSENYFQILGTRPLLGRLFGPAESVDAGESPVAVLSFRQWMHRFGADSSIVGRQVNINRTSFTVIGVAEEGFQGHMTGYEFGVWVPLSMGAVVSNLRLGSRSQTELVGLGRMDPDVSFNHVAAAFAVVTERQREEHSDTFGNRTLVATPYSGMVEFAKKPVSLFLTLLFGIAGAILLIACVNVAGMLLFRASARSKEIAVRLAVGAGRGRVVHQLLIESLLLFLCGGALGVGLAFWTTQLLGTINPPVPLPLAIDFTPDSRVLVFTLFVTLLTGVGFGLAPALQVTKPDLVSSLKKENGGGGGGRGRLRGVFVVAQVTGSAVLLVIAGVFLRALGQADSVELGFEPNGLHVYSVDLSMHNYSAGEGEEYFSNLHQRVAALPGVESASISWVLPMGFDYIGTVFSVPGISSGEEVLVNAGINAVTNEYFETMRIDVLAGRAFDDGDREGTKSVAIVNETAAGQLWPGENAVGKLLPAGDESIEIVGVVQDSKYRTAGENPRAMIYRPRSQRYASIASLVIRTSPGRANIAREVSAFARSLDADLPPQTNAPYSQVIGLSLLPNRAAAATAGAFGVFGLLLASVGLYGILSYSVSMRIREIGIRIALGASGRTICSNVLGEGLRLVAVGLVIGMPMALVAVTLARSMLFGLSPADPLTLVAILATFATVGLLASYLPARRAMRTDPVEAMRCD